jgi:hypothetical protein
LTSIGSTTTVASRLGSSFVSGSEVGAKSGLIYAISAAYYHGYFVSFSDSKTVGLL